jgi:hypothetical protein
LKELARKLGRHPVDRDLVNLTTRRRRLQDRIDKYSTRAAQAWVYREGDLPSLPSDDGVDLQDLLSDDSDDGSDNPFVVPTASKWSPESSALLLPSRLGLHLCNQLGYNSCVLKEKLLRIGQANDALQGLRMALSRKAILFRGLRQTTSKTKRNRSWNDIKNTSGSARHHVTMYLKARRGLFNLGPTEEERSTYQPLTREQLKITAARIDPALRGTRNTQLAWFWTMNIKGDTQDAGDMGECK